MSKLYKHLTEEERDWLLFKAQGRTLREIAELIGREASTIIP